MNYLQLLLRGKKEAGIAGSAPSTIAGAVGDTALLASWISDAFVNLSSEPKDWKWLRDQVIGDAVINQIPYTCAGLDAAKTRFDRWVGAKGVVSMYDAATPSDEWFLGWVDYETFRQRYMIGTHTASKPMYWAESPTGQLLLGPKPDAAYKIRAEYWKTPQVLADDDDTPELPDKFHMILVWKALLDDYAPYDAAAEVDVRAGNHYDRMLASIEEHQSMLSVSTQVEPLA